MGYLTKKEKADVYAAYIAANGNAAQAARAMGLPRSTLWNRVRSMEASGELIRIPNEESPGVSREDFRLQFEPEVRIREAIRKGLAELERDVVLSDMEFRVKVCGISSNSEWNQVVNDDEFKLYQFTCDGKIWWATEKSVEWILENVSKAEAMP